MPSYADLSNISINFGGNIDTLMLNGEEITDGQKLKSIRTDEVYDLSIKLSEEQDSNTAEGRKSGVQTYDMYELIFMRSANLPTLYIDTYSETIDYLNEDKEHWEPGELLCIDRNGRKDSSDKIEKIHGRGFSTWSAIQKSYTFYTASACDILNMGEGGKWRLIICWKRIRPMRGS